MQKRTTRRLSSTKTPPWVTNLWRKRRPASSVLFPENIYSTIETLPLDNFIALVTSGGEDPETGKELPLDLSFLIIEGECDPITLSEAWLGIFLDYLDANKQNHARYKIDLIRDIAILELRAVKVDAILQVLRTPLYVPELVQELNDLGLDADLDPEDVDAYFEALNGIRDRAQELVIDVKLKRLELQELLESEDKEEGDQRVSRMYFVNVLSRIAHYRRVAVIRTGELTVAEFVAAFNDYLDYLDRSNKQPPPQND